MYELFSILQLFPSSFLHKKHLFFTCLHFSSNYLLAFALWHTFGDGSLAMKNIVSQSCVVVLALDRALGLYVASAIECDGCVVVLPHSERELYRVLLSTRVDLVIVVSTRRIRLDDMLYQWVDALLSAGASLFVVMHHRSVHHTLRLLSAGVRQCLTLPIAPRRLRSKVYEHLGINLHSSGVIS